MSSILSSLRESPQGRGIKGVDKKFKMDPKPIRFGYSLCDG